MKNLKENRFSVPLLFFGAFLLAVLIIAAERGRVSVEKEFIVGEPAPRTVFSPAHFSFTDEEETTRLRKEKADQVLPVYAIDSKARSLAASKAEAAYRKRTERGDGEKAAAGAQVPKVVSLLLERFLGEGLLEDSQKKFLLFSGRPRVRRVDVDARKEDEVTVKRLLSVEEASAQAGLFLEKEGVRDRAVKTTALEIFNEVVQPSLFYDEVETKDRLEEALSAVIPVTEEVKRGEMVIQKGLLVTPKQQKRLIQIQRKMSARAVRNRLLTVGLLVFLGLLLSYLYLQQFEPKSLHSPKSVALILATLTLTLAVEKAILLFPGASPYLLPGALGSVLLAILCGPALGVLGAFVISIVSAPLVEFRPEILLMLLLGGGAGAFAARKIRKRLHFLGIGLAVGLVEMAVLAGFLLSQDWRILEAVSLARLGVMNGFLVTILSFFLVSYFFEPVFGVATDITLLELSDLNHPILRRMVVEAPGTYHHSLVVSTLAETACEAIGANALLARVGCYFHDIGKIARSEYFTENQNVLQGTDRHGKLTPTMSCLVIMSHVKDGIELARKYKLKEAITRFIPEHQGTGVIYYFYRKALDQALPGEKVEADDFRYAGPKPQSRETAVAMLADSAEASSRSLKEVTPASIRALVRKVINEKFIDGQLDECDLTLKDLHRIQENFVQTLTAIFHTRVTYPAVPADAKRPDLFEADQFAKFREP